MEDQVPFKVYMFWEENDKPEVRRFGVEKSVVSSFHYINAKLHDVYPGLKNRKFSITWKDEEGDDVNISSDEEMMTALTALSGNLIKLFVYCKEKDHMVVDITVNEMTMPTMPETSEGATGDDNPLHFGVRCDVCDGAVFGNRYKCTVCVDYDLCSKCEAAGNHREHLMVRLPSPALSRAVIKAAMKRSRHIMKTVAAVVEECPYKKHRRDKSGERKHRGDHGHGHGRHGHGDHRGHHHPQRTSWLDTFATYMNEFANLAGDIGVDLDSDVKPDQTQTQKAKENESTQTPKTSEAFNQCPFKPAPLKTVNFNQLLESFGNIVRQQMPSSNVDAPSTSKDDPSTSKSDPSTLKSDPSTLKSDPSTLKSDPSTLKNDPSTLKGDPSTSKDVEMKLDDKANQAEALLVKLEPSDTSSITSSEREESPDKADDWTVINNEKDLMDAYMKATAPSATPASIGFNLPEEFQERVRISEGQNLYPPLNTATAVLNPKEPERPNVTLHPVPPNTPQATGPQPQMYAAQPQPYAAQPQPYAAQSQPTAAQSKPYAAHPQPTAAHPQPTAAQSKPYAAQPQPTAAQPQLKQRFHAKPHIDAAVHQMLAMGFTNDGGWLTQLLDSKDGNIAAVLDLLTPVRPQK